MKYPCPTAMAVFVGLVSSLPASRAADAVDIQPAGIKIVAQAYGKEYSKTAPFQSFNTGTELAISLSTKDTRIVGLDERKSKIASFTDDKGTDLTGGDGEFDAFPKISDDGTFAIMEVKGTGIPASGATTLTAKGTLAVTLGGSTATTRSEALAVKEGTKFTLGDYKFEIAETNDSGDDEKPLSLTLRAKQNLDGVAAIRFLSEDGKEIEASNSGSSSSGFNNSVTVDKYFELGTKGKSILVEIDAYTDLKVEMIPFEITTGIGMGGK